MIGYGDDKCACGHWSMDHTPECENCLCGGFRWPEFIWPEEGR